MNPATLQLPESFADREGEALRLLEWSALVARLAAERDLRRELASGGGPGIIAADFVNGAALVTAGSSRNAPDVNSGSLAKHKSTGGITAAAGAKARVAKVVARGKQ